MQTVATQSNLTITSFKPQPIVTQQLHAEWPIALQLDGTYHNLAIFCDRVGKFTRIVNITGLDIKGKDKPAANSTITASATATTFVLLDNAAAPAKPGRAGAKKRGSRREEGRLTMKAFAIALLLGLRLARGRVHRAGAEAGPRTGRQPAGRRRRGDDASRPTRRYTYQPDGRRDPFLNLLGLGARHSRRRRRARARRD